jgi:signal transduction histidine kinase/ActR/RegA family two-component response regulator
VRLFVAIGLSTLIGLGVFVGGGGWILHSFQERTLTGIAANIASLFAANVNAAAVFEDRATAEEILTNFASLPAAVAAEVTLRDGRTLASWQRPSWSERLVEGTVALPRLPIAQDAVVTAANEAVIAARAPIVAGGEFQGTVVGIIDRQVVESYKDDQPLLLAAAATVALLLALVAARLLQRFVAAPILGISRAMRRIADEGDYSAHIAYLGRDPLGTVADSFNAMVRRISQREQSLRAARLKAEDAARAKQVFLANMSHEMRTPMNVVIGGLHLAGQKEADPEVHELLTTTRQAAETLLGLINEVLDLSKIEAGHAEVTEAPVALPEQLERLRDLLAMRARQKQLSFYVSLAPEAQCTVLTDGQKLMQILTNLTANAIKYTEAGEVGVEVSCLAREGDRGHFRFLVRDTGIGIDETTQKHLFDPFYQAETARDKRFQGTGLGLSISQRLAGLLASTVCVESEPGFGSSFWVDLELPVLEVVDGSEGTADDAVAAQAPAAAPDVAGARVLLVEDTKTSRLIMRGLLEGAGVKVLEACDGYEAIERARDGAPLDAILMDIQMPGMDGVEATRRIRADYQALGLGPVPPIIALTAYAYEEDRRGFLDAGMDGYLSKPVVPDTLMRELARHLSLGVRLRGSPRVSRKK